jgi:hypothetical protein
MRARRAQAQPLPRARAQPKAWMLIEARVLTDRKNYQATRNAVCRAGTRPRVGARHIQRWLVAVRIQLLYEIATVTPLHLRIFLSSPGDVGEERETVRLIADELQRTSLLKGDVTLEVVAWDDPLATTPLDASRTPQASLDMQGISPSDCDLTVVVLWSRLGTPLPESMRKPNGERYASGTEWELEAARAAGKAIFIYHRTEKPRIEIDDPEQQEKQHQYRSLQAFLAKLRAHDGSLRGGLNPYANPAQFRELFRQHLERYVKTRLDGSSRRSSRPPRSGPKRFRIFIASAADDLRTTRMRLVNELGELRDVEVLKEVPPPLEQRAHAATVLECLEEADLCVNLLGNQAGFCVEWEENNWTYPLEQARLGLSVETSQLVLHPPGFDPERIDNPAYRKLIEALNQRDVPRARLELVQCSAPQMVDAILAKRREIEEARRRAQLSVSAITAFLDVHANDQSLANPLLKFLPRENVTPLMPDVAAGDAAPTKLAATFADNLRRAQLFIVIFGQVGRHWVDERLNEGLKLILSERLNTKIGVYIAPPAKDRAQVSFPFPVVNGSSGFEESAVKALLDGVSVSL